MKKSELRKKYLNLRKQYSKEEVLQFSQEIFKNFVAHFSLKKTENVHLFLPITPLNEIDTLFFLEHFWKLDIKTYVPKIVGDQMISLPFTSTTELVKNSWGIWEPKHNILHSEIYDYVLTPLVYCDQFGNRIGYGKGYYDVFFRGTKSNTNKIGLSLFSPEENIDDVSELDVKLDYLVTPTEVLSFNGLL